MNRENVTLIGMPGSGKSTVGVVLAKVLGFRFVDSDIVIQEQTGKLLHELIEEHGDEGFLDIENRINASLQAERAVIATGGSAVYGEEAMAHLRGISTVVYLKLPYPALKRRLGDLKKRGVVLKPGQTLQDLMAEREPLYEKYAHLTVEEENLDIRGVVERIVELLEERAGTGSGLHP
ncbi:MAG: shikimate kinase [Eubacteriales bacterium]|nr:shikimate kinase [Eubacteriales bacterium]